MLNIGSNTFHFFFSLVSKSQRKDLKCAEIDIQTSVAELNYNLVLILNSFPLFIPSRHFQKQLKLFYISQKSNH